MAEVNLLNKCIRFVCEMNFHRKLQTNPTTDTQVTYAWIKHTFVRFAIMMVHARIQKVLSEGVQL